MVLLLLVIFSLEYKCLCCLLIVKLQKHTQIITLLSLLAGVFFVFDSLPFSPLLSPSSHSVHGTVHCMTTIKCVFTLKKRKENQFFIIRNALRNSVDVIHNSFFSDKTTIFLDTIPKRFGPNHTFNIFNILKMKKEDRM